MRLIDNTWIITTMLQTGMNAKNSSNSLYSAALYASYIKRLCLLR